MKKNQSQVQGKETTLGERPIRIYIYEALNRLIHATDPNTIVVYLNLFQLDKKALAKLNALRVLAGQPEI